MKIKKNFQKLNLNKETIDNLNANKLRMVLGGMPPNTEYTQCADISCGVPGGCAGSSRRRRTCR